MLNYQTLFDSRQRELPKKITMDEFMLIPDNNDSFFKAAFSVSIETSYSRIDDFRILQSKQTLMNISFFNEKNEVYFKRWDYDIDVPVLLPKDHHEFYEKLKVRYCLMDSVGPHLVKIFEENGYIISDRVKELKYGWR